MATNLPDGSLPRPHCPARRSEEHTSELQSRSELVCRLLLEKKNAVIDLVTDLVVLHCCQTSRKRVAATHEPKMPTSPPAAMSTYDLPRGSATCPRQSVKLLSCFRTWPSVKITAYTLGSLMNWYLIDCTTSALASPVTLSLSLVRVAASSRLFWMSSLS